MTRLPLYSIRHPKTVIALAMLATLAAAPGVLRLKIKTDGHALIPTNAPEIAVDRAIRDEFLVRDPVVVVITSDHRNGIFNAGTLRLVQDLTDEFQQLPDVRSEDVFSLATEHGHRVRPGTLQFRKFLEPLPTTPKLLQRLRGDLQAIELYNGTLVSADETATAVFVGAPEQADRSGFLATVRDIVLSKGAIPERIDIIGAPVAEAMLGTHILQDLGVPSSILGVAITRDARTNGSPSGSTLHSFRVWLGGHIGLVPIAIGIMFIVFLVGFRSLPAAGLPLMEVGACLVFVFGLMGWLGVPVYLTVAVLPVILTAIGVADEVHIFARYVENLRDRPAGHLETLTATMREMAPPVVKTSVTTAVGFLSFAISPIGPVRAFGIFTAVGVLFCMLWSLTVIPAALAIIPPKYVLSRRSAAKRAQSASVIKQNAWIARPRTVIIVAVIMVCVAPFGIQRIVVQDSWINGFAEDSDFYKATKRFNEQFLGMHTLLLRVDAGCDSVSGRMQYDAVERQRLRWPANLVNDPQSLVGRRVRLERPLADRASSRSRTHIWESWIESVERQGEEIVATVDRATGPPRAVLRLRGDGELDFEIRREPFMEPEMLHHIAAFEDFLEAQSEDAVGGVIGTADYMMTTRLMSRGLNPTQRIIPETRGGVDWLWKQYKRIRGSERLRQVISESHCRSLIHVFLKDANFVDTARLLEKIRDYERTQLKPHGMTISLAGDVAVSQTLIGAIVSTQTRSLLLSLVGILVVASLMGRSLIWGVLCVMPCALAVLINFAVMGWAGIPLGVATSMFAGMTLGIGVDYAIHLMERFRHACDRGLARSDAINDAVRATGPAIFIDALAVGLGFGVLTLSQVPANARLGALVLLSIVSCFTATLLLLPALLRFVPVGPYLKNLRTESAE